MAKNSRPTESRESEFAQQADEDQISFLREYWDFLRGEKRWWMAPILLALLVAGAVLILGGSAVAPLIYAMF